MQKDSRNKYTEIAVFGLQDRPMKPESFAMRELHFRSYISVYYEPKVDFKEHDAGEPCSFFTVNWLVQRHTAHFGEIDKVTEEPWNSIKYTVR